MDEKLIVVTGASRGLGKSMALHLADRGVKVIGTYRSKKDEADDTAQEAAERGGRAVFLHFDTDSTDFDEFASSVREAAETEFGRKDVDGLVNNAGIGINVPFAETTREQFDQLVDIQLRAPYFLTQAMLPVIKDGGRILFVSSGLARFTLPGYSAYAATKGGVEVLTRYLAKELGDRQIRVNCIAPGATETDFGGGAVRDNEKINQMIASTVALGRAGQPDDIGSAAAALLSDDMQWLNGMRVEVSGGQNV